jgi:uncharacterized protein with HEPN domain
MPRSAVHVLEDILRCIEQVQHAAESRTVADLESEWMFRLAVERAIEIISEASRHIPENLKNLRPEIPWPEISSIGNILRHEYHTVATNIVWEVVQKDLPVLREAIVAMLRAADPS